MNGAIEEFKQKEMDPLLRQTVAGSLQTILEEDWYAGDPDKEVTYNIIREKLQSAEDVKPNTDADKALAEAAEMMLEKKAILPDELNGMVRGIKNDYGLD